MTAKNPTLLELVDHALAAQTQKAVTILSSLLAVEDAIHYIPPMAVEQVALYTGATVNDVWAVASFYTNFRFEPPGEHVVEICWGPTCHLKGSQKLLDSVQNALGLAHEGDTPEGGATLKYNTCLGACAQAPVMMVDHHLMGRMTVQRAKDVTNLWNQKS